jgi:hypothetical protein
MPAYGKAGVGLRPFIGIIENWRAEPKPDENYVYTIAL